VGLPGDGVIVFVGRLVDAKAPEILLEAFSRLLDRGVRCHLLMIGDGPRRAALHEHPVGKRVDFRGFLQPREVARMMAASDVFALPSRFETWGAAACEAMAAGLPAVLSDSVGCAPDLVGGHDAGAMVATEDPAALADALARLLAAPDRRTRLHEVARRRSIEWGHDLNLRSVVRALRDARLRLHPATLALADRVIDADAAPLEAVAA
jgi:glycosyltransferase involved in cell wall biosynthesis